MLHHCTRPIQVSNAGRTVATVGTVAGTVDVEMLGQVRAGVPEEPIVGFLHINTVAFAQDATWRSKGSARIQVEHGECRKSVHALQCRVVVHLQEVRVRSVVIELDGRVYVDGICEMDGSAVRIRSVRPLAHRQGRSHNARVRREPQDVGRAGTHATKAGLRGDGRRQKQEKTGERVLHGPHRSRAFHATERDELDRSSGSFYGDI